MATQIFNMKKLKAQSFLLLWDRPHRSHNGDSRRQHCPSQQCREGDTSPTLAAASSKPCTDTARAKGQHQPLRTTALPCSSPRGHRWSVRGSPQYTTPHFSFPKARGMQTLSITSAGCQWPWDCPSVTAKFACMFNPKHILDFSVHCQLCLPGPTQAVGASRALGPT